MSDLEDLAEISEQCAMSTPRSDGRGAKHGRVPHRVQLGVGGTIKTVGRTARYSTSRRHVATTLPAVNIREVNWERL